MAIFNSLGSNYSTRDVWRHLTAKSKKGAITEFSRKLGQHYGGQALLTYKGREALELALKNSGLRPGSAIGINGFTCYAVYRAVENAGFKALLVDIAPHQLNFSVGELKALHTKHLNLKAVIVQNTLGYPADMPAIAAYCQKSGLMVIEDLAHSIGASYADNKETGSVGTFTMLSFSQDKLSDVVAGGALIARRGKIISPETNLSSIGSVQRLKNRLYPLWTWLIRSTYPIGMGRILHFGLKKLHWMATPMSDDLEGLHAIPASVAALLMDRWQGVESELEHRRQIASIYMQQLPAALQPISPISGKPSYLRFPVWINDRKSLLGFLRSQQIFISDTWYDVPIGPVKYFPNTNYQSGTCPNSEELTNHIINLPTHMNVTPEVATNICAKIKQWQLLQQKR